MLNGNVNDPVVCVIASVVVKLAVPVFAIATEPTVLFIVMPPPEIVLLLKSTVPVTNVNCLVAPNVKFAAKVQVAVLDALPNVHGKSYVVPATGVIVFEPLVAVNDHAFVPAVNVVVPFDVLCVKLP